MATRLCLQTALAACLALGASMWGTQSTAPAVLTPADAAQSRLASSVQFPLAEVVEPQREAPSVSESPDEYRHLRSSESFTGYAVADVYRKEPRTRPTLEVVSFLPPVNGGS
jgi:hypothetical protein